MFFTDLSHVFKGSTDTTNVQYPQNNITPVYSSLRLTSKQAMADPEDESIRENDTLSDFLINSVFQGAAKPQQIKGNLNHVYNNAAKFNHNVQDGDSGL